MFEQHMNPRITKLCPEVKRPMIVSPSDRGAPRVVIMDKSNDFDFHMLVLISF